MVGTAFSVMIRMELSLPGSPFLAGDYQLYNVIVTAHAFIMVFLCANAVLPFVYLSNTRTVRMFYKSTDLPLSENNIGDQSMSVKPH